MNMIALIAAIRQLRTLHFILEKSQFGWERQPSLGGGESFQQPGLGFEFNKLNKLKNA